MPQSEKCVECTFDKDIIVSTALLHYIAIYIGLHSLHLINIYQDVALLTMPSNKARCHRLAILNPEFKKIPDSTSVPLHLNT